MELLEKQSRDVPAQIMRDERPPMGVARSYIPALEDAETLRAELINEQQIFLVIHAGTSYVIRSTFVSVEYV